MSFVASFVLACCCSQTLATELPEILQSVLQSDTSYQWISCNIDIELDVPGVHMPEKEIELRLEKGKKPKIKSEGITILPKHGVIGQYQDFLNVNCQAIPLKTGEDTLVYKVEIESMTGKQSI